jgi:hypothetical protein
MILSQVYERVYKWLTDMNAKLKNDDLVSLSKDQSA